MLRKCRFLHLFARLVHIAFKSVEAEILLQRHAVLDGEHLVVIIINAMVEDGLYDLVFTGLRVEKQGVELLKNMLHRERHVTVTSCKVKVILLVWNQISLDGATDALIEELVLISIDDDGFHKRFVNIQRFD